MKKKTIATSLMTITMCASLAAGATFALFTSESKVNVAVTTGKVEVTAAVDELTTYSMGEATAENGTFANGGTAKLEEGGVVVERMTPGDGVVAKLTVENGSNVNTLQRLAMRAAGEDDGLMRQLLIGISEDGTDYTYYNSLVTEWTEGAAGTATYYVNIVLPAYATDAAQDGSAEMTLTVEAVQGNADVSADEGEASEVRFVSYTTDEEANAAIAEALGAMADGETLVLGNANTSEDWTDTNVTINVPETLAEVNICGEKLGTVTITAGEDSTVNLYNDANNVIAGDVGGNSLHVYGSVETLTVNGGRAVVESGAEVGAAAAVPGEGKNADVEIAQGADVAKVTVDTSAANSSAGLTVAEGAVVPSLSVSGDGAINIENNGEVQLEGATVDTVAELSVAMQLGGVVDLAADVTVVPNTELSKEDGDLIPAINVVKDTVLNLNGHTVATTVYSGSYDYTPAIFSVMEGATLTVNGEGTVTAEAGYNNSYGFNVCGGELIINGGSYYGAMTAVQVEKGSATINGGYFALAPTIESAVPEYSKYIINCIDSAYNDGTARVYINGGTFNKFDPTKSPEAGNPSFVTEGHVTYKDGDNYTVKAEEELGAVYVINETTGMAYVGDNALELALNELENEDTATLKVSGAVSFDWGNTSYDNSGALKLQNKTIVGVSAEGAEVTFSGYGSANPIKNATFKNITVKDKTEGDSESAWEHGYLEVENLTAEGVVFADQIQLNGTCTLTGCTFEGSYSQYGAWVNSGNVTFTGCTFEGMRELKIHEAYGSEVTSVVVDGCTFNDTVSKAGIDFGTLNAETSVTIKNSTFNYEIYEGDTPVENFTYVAESNTVVNN